MAVSLADDIVKCIFFNENGRIPIQSLLKFYPRSPFDNKAALVQVDLAPRRPQAMFWTIADPIH